MHPPRLVARPVLAVLGLFLAATSLASSSMSAPRVRLRPAITPRTLPSTGGTIQIRVSTGGVPLDDAWATIVRPDRTPVTARLASAGGGEFENSVTLHENEGRATQTYSVRVYARGEASSGFTANAGTVRVRGSADVEPVIITHCTALPRQLPSGGGTVRIAARITGLRRISVQAHVSGAGVNLEPTLTLRGGLYQTTVTLPANTTASPAIFLVRLSATPSGGEPVEADCGSLIVASPEPIPGIAVVGISRNRPLVRTFSAETLDPLGEFFAFPVEVSGVTIATGDITGDGVADFTLGTGPGVPALVQEFRGGNHDDLGSFFPYGSTFTGGVYVAAGDVNGDGRSDIVTGAGVGGGPHVKVFDGLTGEEHASFFANNVGFRGGVRVAAGDVNGDGFADIITGTGPGAPPHIKVFDGKTLSEIQSFFAYGTTFTGGVFVAAGDVNGDGRADVITGAGAGAGPHVKVFDGRTAREASSFFAFSSSFTGGITVAAADLDGDGRADIITGAGSGAPGGHVKMFSGATGAELRSFLPFDSGFTGGVSVAGWR